uniref:NADH-ubiquinone oxidoreductase chain 6 n=1 Tax=Monognathus jesperseni TaxID=556250 RepID=D1YUD7_9TELE|nr:NADH dehydrogenase subunit 6 [Monognathus jesperseni]
MMSFVVVLFVVVWGGFIGVASNPSPYYAAFGLVVAAGAGCILLMFTGGTFISLVLFLIYLGGMLVVFAYSAALTAEPYPETWVDWLVVARAVGYLLLLGLGAIVFEVSYNKNGFEILDEGREMSVFCGDFLGVALVYSSGAMMMIACGWTLLLTLYVVLELSRGRGEGALRLT